LGLVLPLAGGCGTATNTTSSSAPSPTDTTTPAAPGDGTRVTAGGATFVDPIMQKWSKEYKAAQIDYVAQGSSYGIKEMTKKSLAFGCSDAPMNKKEVENAQKAGGEVIHIPVAIGAVAVIYNLDGVKDLKLSGEVVAEIYMRKITKWNDDKIAKLNPGVALPDKGIVPVARIEGSGTSNIFSEFLGKRSADFKAQTGPGVSKEPRWPEGVERKKENAGIADFVKQTPNTIGYVELAYAKNNGISCASIVNRAGQAVAPDAGSVTAAVEAAMKKGGDKEPPYSLHPLAYSFTDADGDASYPIVGASYALLYKNPPKDKGGAAVVEFLKWVVTDGQKFAAEMHYAPLPADLSKKAKELLDGVKAE
jgi:phosphate transport system substrate-binding protein